MIMPVKCISIMSIPYLLCILFSPVLLINEAIIATANLRNLFIKSKQTARFLTSMTTHLSLSKIFTTIPSKTREFVVEIFRALKNAKIRHFAWCWLKTLIIRDLSRYFTKISLLECKIYIVTLQKWLRWTLTEPLLGFNGASVALQKCHKRTLKVPLLKANER